MASKRSDSKDVGEDNSDDDDDDNVDNADKDNSDDDVDDDNDDDNNDDEDDSDDCRQPAAKGQFIHSIGIATFYFFLVPFLLSLPLERVSLSDNEDGRNNDPKEIGKKLAEILF